MPSANIEQRVTKSFSFLACRQVLRIVRLIARVKRRAFHGKEPHWAKDLPSLISYVNFLELVPTIVIVTLAPYHFFKNLCSYVKIAPRWFKTPIKFFTASATMLGLIIFWWVPEQLKAIGVEKAETVAMDLIFFCVAVPILIPIVCLFFRAILSLANALPSGKVPVSLKTNLMIPLAPLTYRELRLSDFCWGFFYFVIYFLIALQLYNFVLAWILMGFEWLMRGKEYEPSSSTSGVGIVFTSMLVLFAIIGFGLLIRPYLWLLRAAAKIPTGQMMRASGHSLRERIEQMHAVGSDVRLGRLGQVRWGRLLEATEQAVKAFERSLAAEDRRAVQLSPNRLRTLAARRRRAYGKVLDIEVFRPKEGTFAAGSTKYINLIDRIDRIRLNVEAENTCWRDRSLVRSTAREQVLGR